MPKKEHPKKTESKIVMVCSSVSECARATLFEADVESQRFFKRTIRRIKRYKYWKEAGYAAFALVLWFAGIYIIFFSAPPGFPDGLILRVRKGATVSQVAAGLREKKIIRSELLFKILTRLKNEKGVIAGDYKLPKRASVFNVASRLAGGIFGIEDSKITIVEGHNSRELATLLNKSLPAFDEKAFLDLAGKEEGRLFPDTYFIKPTYDETDIVNLMTDNFKLQTLPLQSEIAQTGHNFDEILTMASIIELEARTPETRRMISGILWNRIKRGMKLQVDCVFPYLIDKYSLHLTVADLGLDSPYNTYKYKGLPPGPISNPGIDSIKAAISPAKTGYLYYLSDSKGEMHYATTYATHMANRRKYLAGQ